jgi:tungstate transport system permease protein
MRIVWFELHTAVALIFRGNPYLWRIIGYTLELTAMAAGTATAIGVPVGVLIGLGHFPGRRLLVLLANAGLALPPVLVAATLFVFSVGRGPLVSFDLTSTRQGIYVAQTILALPYVVALTAAALQALPQGLLNQARLLGARPRQVAWLALTEARRGVITAVIAAVGTCLSEVAVISILGGNIYGYDQTLASATLFETNGGSYPDALALAMVLGVLILLLMGGLGAMQQSSDGLGLKLSASTTGVRA